MHPLRGIALKLTSVMLFMVMASLVKAAGDAVPTGQAVFFRSLFAIPVIFGWLAMRGELATGLRTRKPMGHLWRGVIGTSAMACGFAALVLLPLPEATALGYAAPLITVALAAIMLGERVRLFRWSAVAIGFLGVMVVMWPRLSVIGSADALAVAALLGTGLALASAALRALAHVHIRRLTATETTPAIVFYFSLTATVLSLMTLPFGWVIPSIADTAMLVGAGLLGGVAQIVMTSAYARAPASLLAPFDYASMLLALAIGYAFFGEIATWPMLIGAALVIASGIAIIWRERQLGLQRGKARPGVTPQG